MPNSCIDNIGQKIQARDCVTHGTVAKKNGKRFEIKRQTSPDEIICKIEVDCWIPHSRTKQKKCDTVFIRCRNQESYFVELKGGGVNVEEAYEQLCSTIIYSEKKLGVRKGLIHGYIVGGRIKTKPNQRFKKMKEQFYKEYRGELKRGSQTITKTI